MEAGPTAIKHSRESRAGGNGCAARVVGMTRATRGETFRSLRVRNYRLFFVGQLLSMCGTWMSSIAQSTFILYRLDGKGRELGYLSAATFLPILMFTLWAGTIADRSDKRLMLIRIQIFFVSVSTVQTLLVLSGHATVLTLCAIAFLMGWQSTEGS